MWGLKEVVQKLNYVAGDVNRILGVVRTIKEFVIAMNYKLDIVSDKSSFYFSQIWIDNITIEGRIKKITMNEFQQVSATYAATKKNGQPAEVQNAVAVSDNEAALTATLDEATKRATWKAVQGSITEPTAVAVRVTGDADLGEGVREISVEGSVLVTPGEADALTLTFEEPVDQ